MRDVFAPNGGSLAKRFAQYLRDKGAARGAQDAPDEVFWTEADPVLSVYDHCDLLQRSARVSGDPHFGLALAERCDLRDAGVIGYMMRACTTLGGACTTLTQLSGTFATKPPEAANTDAGSTDAGSTMTLAWSYGGQAKLDLRHWAEFTAALIVLNFYALTENAVRPLHVQFAHENDAVGTEVGTAIERILGIAPDYGCSENRIVYAAQDVHAPLVSCDPQLFDILQSYADLLTSNPPVQSSYLSIAVERMIMDGLTSGDASLAKVAGQLGMSQRTLSRRLTAEETSFFDILERVRKSAALRYLATRETPLSEIAFLLGYSSLSSFNDAFRRWTGSSPGSYRTHTLKQK